MILNHINHKMPIYKDCTLIEVMVVAVASLLFLAVLFSIATKLLFGYLWPGYFFANITFVFVAKFFLAKLQKLKYGKPYGYYQHLAIKKLSQLGLVNAPYLTRLGRWSVRRYLL